MTTKLDIKVTISEAVTPTLYQMMMSIKEPRDRASVLKHAAENYLREVSVAPLTSSNVLLRLAPGRPLPSALADVASIEKKYPTRSPHGAESPVADLKEEPLVATGDNYRHDLIGDTFAGFS